MMKNERFVSVYEKYANLVFQYALKMTKNEELAKEIVQQVFLKFYESMDKVDESIEKPWLLVCCKNEITDYFRKPENKNRVDNFEPTGVDVEVRAEDNTEYVVEHMLQENLTIEIMEALRRRNKSWFHIVQGIAVLEMSQEELAEQLGISVEVLRAKLYRARKYIRGKFGDKYDEI